MDDPADLHRLPGSDLVAKGLEDLKSGTCSDEALLVLVAAHRLRGLGFEVPDTLNPNRPVEHELFTRIEDRDPSRAHVSYNALIQRIVSFAQAYEQVAARSRKGAR